MSHVTETFFASLTSGKHDVAHATRPHDSHLRAHYARLVRPYAPPTESGEYADQDGGTRHDRSGGLGHVVDDHLERPVRLRDEQLVIGQSDAKTETGQVGNRIRFESSHKIAGDDIK